MEISGNFCVARVFTNNIENEAFQQIKAICNIADFENKKIRIMPDVHSGKGCIVGFTAEIGENINPYYIGVDIGCGLLAVNLGKININFDKFDKFIRKSIPYGMNKNEEIEYQFEDEFVNKLKEVSKKLDIKTGEQLKAIGSLGGGNHFIEINKDSKNNIWLAIHTGSRVFGYNVATYHQNKYDIKEFNTNDYLHDIDIAQQLAVLNRKIIANKIVEFLKVDNIIESIDTIHNYIDLEYKIMRKGAISAKKGEKLLIPLNMRDGIIIGIGKGNEDWNYSAPHGAGRRMSRSKAKESIDFDEFKKAMKNVWSSTVTKHTIDEAPQAYKPKKEIIENIKDSVDIIEIITPLYNFKGE